MKKILGKKQVMLAVLVVALGVAVYLNYYFTVDNKLATDTSTSSSGNFGDAHFVDNPSTATKPDESKGKEVIDPSDYFVQARLNRETARQEALDVIRDMINDVKASQKTQELALEKAAALSASIEQESKIENLIKAKGFKECIAYIEDDKCNVVVRSEDLKASQALQITDIVSAQSKVVAQNVNIVTVK
ncbi:MAG: SpoIIIAH-like family protein [Oscillospiraceae bacterium]|nr:SpoIIIAH-like family protein [Oscillospiraceae bacterium]MDD4413654.1 SpoIIIAH-like family protein [Oscillospiraceae bacterium]